MVNQRFWGRECRQVLSHLQPPQVSSEASGGVDGGMGMTRVDGIMVPPNLSNVIFTWEIGGGFGGYTMNKPAL